MLFMQEKYTENIDQLDDFYKDALKEARVEPPADMWDKISMSNKEQEKPKGFFFRRSSWLLLLLLLTIITIALLFFFPKETTPLKQEIPVQENNHSIAPQLPGEITTDPVSTEELKSSGAKPNAVTNKRTSGELKSEEPFSSPSSDRLPTPEVPIKTPETPAPTIGTTKQDSSSVPQEENTRKKIRFRDKYKEEYNKDSLRPLFIPSE